MPLPLIDQDTGEFDWTFIKRHAVVRADREYGTQGAPVAYVRDQINYLRDVAAIQRKRWRASHGLPDDTPYTIIDIPSWGASGESFARG